MHSNINNLKSIIHFSFNQFLRLENFKYGYIRYSKMHKQIKILNPLEMLSNYYKIFRNLPPNVKIMISL